MRPGEQRRAVQMDPCRTRTPRGEMDGMATPATLDHTDLERELHTHRRELTGYCYRMLGSPYDAEDAVQETLVRAWRALERFDGRSSLRSWMYRIATNVCLDALKGRGKRALPMDLGTDASPPVAESLGAPWAEHAWVGPINDDAVLTPSTDPAQVAAARESVRLAFVAALQHLPPRQRAVLVLRDVLRWSAVEVAELLDTSVASVTSALQRARATLAARRQDPPRAPDALEAAQHAMLERYVDAFERYDMTALVALLHDDATQSMPPFALWLDGVDDIVTWMRTVGHECAGSKLLPVTVNGCVGFGQYRPDPRGGHTPWGLQVLDVSDGRISRITSFIDPGLFPAVGLPEHLPG